MINIGQYIESAINWMMVHFATFFDAVNAGIGSFIIGFQHILSEYLYITILVLAAPRMDERDAVRQFSPHWDYY